MLGTNVRINLSEFHAWLNLNTHGPSKNDTLPSSGEVYNNFIRLGVTQGTQTAPFAQPLASTQHLFKLFETLQTAVRPMNHTNLLKRAEYH